MEVNPGDGDLDGTTGLDDVAAHEDDDLDPDLEDDGDLPETEEELAAARDEALSQQVEAAMAEE